LKSDYYEYNGILHIHSIYSDGAGTIEEISKAAKEANVDFIGITDHNTLRGLEEKGEGFVNEVFVLIGCEINDKFNKNHYLAFGIKQAPSIRLSAKDYVKFVKEQNGIGFIAHPFEKRNAFKEHPPYPWIEWESEDFDGIEIWNHMSQWMENLSEDNKYEFFIHPLKFISKPCEESLKKFDEISLKRKISAIGGVDAHAHKVNILGFVEVEVFPYKVMFKSIRNYILVKEPLIKDKSMTEKNKQIILNALRNGNLYVANSYRGDPQGFKFWAEYNDKTFIMGDEINFNANSEIIFKCYVPHKESNILLKKNGKTILEKKGNELLLSCKEKGIYRVEVILNNVGWIYSNPIRVI